MSSSVDENKKAAAMELFCVVCRAGGVMELGRAVANLSAKSRLVVQCFGAANFISSRFSNIFKVQKTGPDKSTVEVEAMMPLKFCPEASGKTGCPKGQSCIRLHLCPYFIKGKCQYDKKCRCSHNIKDDHTMAMLCALNLEDIDDVLWLQLLRKVLTDTQIERGASTHDVPEICKFYNNQGGCSMREKCAFLHVCKHFIDGTCKFGDGCKREHDLLKDKHNCDVFEKFSLGSANCNQLIYILKGREKKRTSSTSSDSSIPADHHAPVQLPRSSSFASVFRVGNTNLVSPQSTVVASNYKVATLPQTATNGPEKQSTDICGFFLRGQCNYGEKCMNLHKDLPYQWQLKDASSWKDLSEDWNIMLEREYCNADTNDIRFYHQGQAFITNFDKMIAVAEQGQAGPPIQIRRLSTVSSAEAPPGHIYSTQWLWYWQDERNKWQSYDSPDDGCEPSTTCSKSLEKDFVQGKESHPFSAGHHSYSLYYKKMLQKNNSFQTERAVRRRPEFVAKERMKEIAQGRKEALKMSKLRTSSVSEISAFPPYWDPMSENNDFIRVPLSVTSQEYKDVEKKFQETLEPKKKIKKIERIQNPDLWIAYTQKKARMAKKANDTPPKEMPQLFHGTSCKVVDAVCQQGFDWRMCGKHGTLYGKGTYFARAASYSHRYTEHGDGKYCEMFVARVLVGSYDVGEKSYTRPPPKDPSKPHGDLYDSCVNDVNNPGLYVVFENNQSYPEYLVTYKS